MNGDELRQFWSFPEPWSIVPVTQGVNNLTQVIKTAAGDYVLRSYRSDRSLRQIRYELEVLKKLQGRMLPFQVPAPIPTVRGELFGVLSGAVVSLSPRLTGSSPSNDDLEQAYAAGEALAELVRALDGLDVEVTSEIAPFPPSGDFKGWSGIPIVPEKLLENLPLEHEEREQVLARFEEVQDSVTYLYQTLPQQIIHRDYDQSNILMEGNSVTGVLDFEFCGPDLRVLDLTYALSQWPSGLWDTGQEWAVIDAFGQRYLQQQKLIPAELEALPLVLRLRAFTSLFFHLGRFANGVDSSEAALERIREKLTADAWLQINAEELVRHAHHWQT